MKPNNTNPALSAQTPNVPNWLPTKDGVLTRAGKAPDSNAYLYIKMTDGTSLRIFVAAIVSTGAKFSVASVPDSFALDRVRVSPKSVFGEAALSVGQQVLLSIEFTEKGPQAGTVWPFELPVAAKRSLPQKPASLPPAPKPTKRLTGTVLSTDENLRFAFILVDRSGDKVFGHASAFLNGCSMEPGTRVGFSVTQSSRGPAASEIRALSNS